MMETPDRKTIGCGTRRQKLVRVPSNAVGFSASAAQAGLCPNRTHQQAVTENTCCAAKRQRGIRHGAQYLRKPSSGAESKDRRNKSTRGCSMQDGQSNARSHPPRRGKNSRSRQHRRCNQIVPFLAAAPPVAWKVNIVGMELRARVRLQEEEPEEGPAAANSAAIFRVATYR